MKMLSYLTLTALLSISACSHGHKKACCEAQKACCKQKQECKDGSCPKDQKNAEAAKCTSGECKKS